MPVEAVGTDTYLFVNGISVRRPIPLGVGVTILPAKCKPMPDDIIHSVGSEIDLGIVAIFLRNVSSQIHLNSTDAENLVKLAWNTQWDVLLLSAILNCRASCNLQSHEPAESFGPKSQLIITTYHIHILDLQKVYRISNSDEEWIKKYFSIAHGLLKVDNFTNAVHSMASYHWHPHPRAKMAILWSGIEGLFSIESELAFRLSLYCARFLHPKNEKRRKATFSSVKKLYKIRSTAVHGSRLEEKLTDQAVIDSAKLLQNLIRRCIETTQIPNINNLAP